MGRCLISYATILQCYSLSDILELNDKTEEEALEFLVEYGFINLPEVTPVEFEN